MKPALAAAAVAAFISFATQVHADDASQSKNASNNSQSMKDCMARQKATNSSLTQSAMETVCKNEQKKHKTQKEGNDLATGPQANTPPK
jgi:hypothetical protein